MYPVKYGARFFVAARASINQNVQMTKATEGVPKPSFSL